MLDEELSRLPEKFRVPLMLCYLESRSRDEAAGLLGVSLTTLCGRLEQGRARLRARLTRRGITLSASLLVPVLVEGTANATIPASLTVSTTRIAAALASGRPVLQPTRGLLLASEGMKAMLESKLAVGVSLLLALAALGLGGMLAAGQKSREGEDVPPADDGPKVAAGKADGAISSAEALPPGAVARLGTTRLRTTATALTISPDAKTLRTAAGARTIGRWDPESGQLLDEVHLKGPVSDRCWFSPDGRFVAVPDAEGIGLYDAQTGERKRTVAVDDKSRMTLATFSPNGLTLATAEYESKDGMGTGCIRLWPVGGDESMLLAKLPSYANGLTFSPDGKRLYGAVDNHSVRCWDVATAKELWKNDHWAMHLSASPDGKLLATHTYQEGPLRLWNAETGESLATLDSGKRSWSVQVSFSPDGRTVAHGTNDGALLWDASTRKLLHRLPSAGAHFAFSPDSASVFTLGPILERWDVGTGKPLYPEARGGGHVGPVTAAAFSPDGHSVATTGTDGTLRIWDRTTGKHNVHRAPNRSAARNPLAYTSDGLVVMGEQAGSLALVDPATGREVRRFVLPQKPGLSTDVITARLAADGHTLLALGTTQEPLGGRKVSEIPVPMFGWDVRTGKVVLEKTVSCQHWGGAAFSPSGRFLALAGSAELREVWRDGRRPLLPAPSQPAHFAFSPDGRWIAMSELGYGGQRTKRILVYEVLTGRQISRLEGESLAWSAMAFSPDGRLLASPGSDALNVWEVATGRTLMHLPVRGRVTHWAGWHFAHCLAFAPDGQTLATGHGDGTGLLWDTAPAWKGLTIPKGAIDEAASWADLAMSDPKTGCAAMERLAANPTVGVRLLRERLRPESVDAQWLADRIADLSSDDFKTRETATDELKRVAESAESALSNARRTTKSPEVFKRLGGILVRPAVPSADVVRSLRAVAVLERIGTEETRAVLKNLAGGASGAELTHEAKAALERIRAR